MNTEIEEKKRKLQQSIKEIEQKRKGEIGITTIGTKRKQTIRHQAKRYDMHSHQMPKKKKIKQIQDGHEPMLEESVKQYFGIICKQHPGTGWMNITGNWKKTGHEKMMKITFLVGKFEDGNKQAMVSGNQRWSSGNTGGDNLN